MLEVNNTKFNGLNVSGKWISRLESTNSRNEKEQILEQALMFANLGSEDADAFLYNCYLTYNPFFVFNIKQVPTTVALTDQENPWPEFWALCEELRTRSVTGNLARDMIAKLSKRFDSDNWNNACRRILTKDLRVGISEKTLNKVLKNTQWEIPVFSCQLASDSKDNQKKMLGKKQIELKLDGVRLLAIVTGATVNLMSRNGKPFDNFPHIAEEIQKRYNELAPIFGPSFVIDGEVIGQSFQMLMKQARRKTDINTDDTIYHVFDVVPSSDFKDGESSITQSKRTETLFKAKEILECDCIQLVDNLIVDLDTDEGVDQMWDFANKAISDKFEGIMIKDLDAPYKCKRSTSWLKYKPVETFDLSVIGYEEGTGKNEGKLGALICEGEDNGRIIRVNVGSGFTDVQRESFWEDRDIVLGRVIEIQADTITKNQDGTYSLRFPRFERFRSFSDAPSEKA